MPDFNFRPSIMGVSFYRGQRGNPEDDYISEIKFDDFTGENGAEGFELGMRLTLGGLDYLRHPLLPKHLMEHNYETFYLHIATYTQRGMRDFVIGGVVSEFISEEIMKKGSFDMQLTLTKFHNQMKTRFEDEDRDFEYDYISNILFVRVFMTKQPLEDTNDLNSEMFERYNLLFETKLPFINKRAWEWDRSGMDF